MRSVTIPVKIPQALWDHRQALKKATGAKSVNAMWVGLYRYAMMHGKEHTLTNAISDMSESAQDEVDDGIIKKFLAGESLHGSYFEHKIDESVERHAKGASIPKEKVTTDIIEKLRQAGAETPCLPVKK